MLAPIRVVAITDHRRMGTTREDYSAAIERAVRGCPPGSVLVQIREKGLDGGTLLDLVRIARRYARVIVNDRVDVALAADAQAVHLPEAGLAVADARALFAGVIGVSRHDPAAIASTGADLVHLGPIFETPSKPGLAPLGLEVLGTARGAARLVAVGGIDSPARAREAAQAGADAVALIRAAWSGASLVPFVTAVDAGRALRASALRS